MNDLWMRLAGYSSQKSLVLGAVASALFYFTLFDDGSVLNARINQVKTELAQAEAKEVESKKALQDQEIIQQSLEGLAEQFKLVSSKIPSEMQMTEVISAVDRAASVSGITISAKAPQNLEKKDLYETIPLSLEAEGSYGQIGLFFYNLSKEERLIRIRNFKIWSPAELRSNARLRLAADVVSYKLLAPKKDPKGAP